MNTKNKAMIQKTPKLAIALTFLFWPSFQTANAIDFILPIDNEHDRYFVALLEAAVKAADGDHIVHIHKYDKYVPQTRTLRIMLSEESPVNITFTGHSIQREKLLQQIDIPLLRGLLGYRLLAIRGENAEIIRNQKTLLDLTQNITLGSCTSWPDTYILQNAGFHVETGNVDNLWHMLHRGRYTALPMGMHEIKSHLSRFKDKFPDSPVQIDTTVMLQYHYDYFFYVSPHDTIRANIVKQGLMRLYETGEFMRIFTSAPFIQTALIDAEKHKRTIFQLANPHNSERVQAIPAKYWHTFKK